MKSFKQHLSEKWTFPQKALAALTMGSGLFAGHSALKNLTSSNITQTPMTAKAPSVSPRTIDAGQVKADVNLTPEEQPPYEFSHPNVERLLGGIAKAEHRGHEGIDHTKHDPRLMIRTRGGGGTSSAYGPYQITRDLVKGLVRNNPDEFAPIKDFTDKFIKQGTTFLKSDNKHPEFGLGGVGTLSGSEHHNSHQQLGDLAIRGLAKEKNIDITGNMTPAKLDVMIRAWRGKPRSVDPKYYQIIHNHFFGEPIKESHNWQEYNFKYGEDRKESKKVLKALRKKFNLPEDMPGDE
jgi:hypothetical protein